jgi:hypothetical protein
MWVGLTQDSNGSSADATPARVVGERWGGDRAASKVKVEAGSPCEECDSFQTIASLKPQSYSAPDSARGLSPSVCLLGGLGVEEVTAPALIAPILVRSC